MILYDDALLENPLCHFNVRDNVSIRHPDQAL